MDHNLLNQLQQLEKDKQHENEETDASQRKIEGRIRAINDNPSQENQE
jgi:hypothetical protein